MKVIDAGKVRWFLTIAASVLLSSALSIGALLEMAGLTHGEHKGAMPLAKGVLIPLAVLIAGGVVIGTYREIARRFALPRDQRSVGVAFLLWVAVVCGAVTLLNGAGTLVGAAEMTGADLIRSAQEIEVQAVTADLTVERAQKTLDPQIKILEEELGQLTKLIRWETEDENNPKRGLGPNARELLARQAEVRKQLTVFLLERDKAQVAADSVAEERAKAQNSVSGTGAFLAARGMSFKFIPFVLGALLALIFDVLVPIHSAVMLSRLYREEQVVAEMIGESQFRTIEEQARGDRSVVARWILALAG